MRVGYARVSTTERHLDLQRDALPQAGCDRLFTDAASGATAERPGLTVALHYLRAGDVLAMWKLDRLGRSLKHLVGIMNALEHWGIGLERTYAGLQAARTRGRHGGQPRKLSRKGVELAVSMLQAPRNRISDICATVSSSHTTLYRYAKTVKGATR